MNITNIKYFSTVNGNGVRTAVFVSGCNLHCEGCFNSGAWSFDTGHEMTAELIDKILDSIEPEYISGLSILGGEPLCNQNIDKVTDIAKKCKEKFPEKQIWVWTRYDFETDISSKEIVKYADYIVDGEFILEQKDLSLAFRGSKNQHIWEKQADGTWKNRSDDL